MWKAFTALAVLASLATTAAVKAEDWPTRPLTMINPFAAGGPNDVLARLFAQRMGEILGQPIVIENIGGGGGMNGADRVAKAAPDGYTFLLGNVGTQKRNHATVESMKTPAVREKLQCAGLKFVSDERTTPEYLAKFVQSDIAKWAV